MAKSVSSVNDDMFNAESLRKVLNYSDQHRIVISKAIQAEFPDQWPDEIHISKETFYESLLQMLKDSELRNKVIATLFELAKQKDKGKGKEKWLEILYLPSRIILQTRWLVSDFEEARAILKEKGVVDLLEMLTEEGHPEFGWWYQLLESSIKTNDEAAVIEDRWRTIMDELSQRAAESAKESPSTRFVSWLQSIVEGISSIAQKYEEVNDRSEILKVCNEILDEIGAIRISDDIQSLISEARSALEKTDWSRSRLDSWSKQLKKSCNPLQEAQYLVIKWKEAIQTAINDNDYRNIRNYANEAEEASRKLNKLQGELVELFKEITLNDDDTKIGPEDPVDDLCPNPGQTEIIEEPQIEETTSSEIKPGIQENQIDETIEDVIQEIDSLNDESSQVTATTQEVGFSSIRPELSDKPDLIVPQNNGETIESPLESEEMELLKEPVKNDENIQWDASVSVKDLAEEVMRHEGLQRVYSAQGLVWALIREDRIPLAYHLAYVIFKNEPKANYGIHPEILRSIHLGKYLAGSAGEEVIELSTAIKRIYEVDLNRVTSRVKRPLTLLIFAALLRPVLIAPHATKAADLMRSLSLDEELSSLHALREEVLDPGINYQAMLHLDPGDQLVELRNQIQEWWEINRRHNFKYEPATWSWRHLLEKGSLHHAYITIMNHGAEGLNIVRKLVEEFQSKGGIERMIRQADQEVRGRKANKNPIVAGPLKDMENRCDKIIGLFVSWVAALEEQEKSVQSPGRVKALRNNRDRLLSNLNQVFDTMSALGQEEDLAISAASACVVSALKDVQERLSGATMGILEYSEWWRALNGVLLPEKNIVLAENLWYPQWSAEGSMFHLVDLAKLVDPPDWEACFDTANLNCNHIRTAQILDWLRYEKEDTDLLDTLARKREDGLRKCLKAFELILDKARDEVERAAGLSYLSENDRSRLVSNLEAANICKNEDSFAALKLVRKVQEELNGRKNQQIDDIRRRIKENEVSDTDPDAYRKISELLESGDVLTASEYILLLEDGQSIPESIEYRDIFRDEYFPSFVDNLQKYLGQRGVKDIILEAIKHQKLAGPLDMRHVPGAQGQSATEMLYAWQLLKAKKGDFSDNLKQLLERFGFAAVKVARVIEGGLDTRERVFDVNARSIADRDICVVPRYGSQASGQYRILCIWERPSEEDVLASAQAQSGGQAIIVVYFGQLSVKRRRDLAFRSRERKQTLLVIDETLVYFLCTERGSRLATLFECALPFTVAKPYITTSSDVPTELFFGRRQELADVFDQFGTNLVYGGRQLGKTALLRAVVRRFHDPKRGIVVAWIDLKERHIGLSEPADAVWQAIDRELVQQKVLVNVNRRSPEGTADAITRWLNEAPERRILMLLDEADAFLTQDANDADYRTVGTLKGLMERSERRFKVVFAGLHNVQRTSRDVNTPLAHFGNPVCIGPLLTNGEAKEAFQLAERPLRQLGFRFESPSLVNRILAQTNYYPNLIQIFCDSLLKYLYEIGGAGFDLNSTPPYVITRDHIEVVSQGRDLQQTIRSRFQITLDLDNRYQVVALSVALETKRRQEAGNYEAGAFGVEWIRQQALSWWEQGFSDRCYDAFRALLEEMVGLGVLRRAGSEYALRSPAIAGLLGGQAEIEEALIEASGKAPPELYQAAIHRRGKRGDLWMRSPLTGQQESEILAKKDGIVLLFGTALAGLEQVPLYLDEMVADKNYVELTVIEGIQDAKGFEHELKKTLSQSGKIEGIRLLAIPHSAPWTESWVKLSRTYLTRHQSTRIVNRVLFIGNTRNAWDWLGSVDQAHYDEKTTVISLSPWSESFVEHWAKDAGFGPLGKDTLDSWREVTGWWGGLMEPLGEKLKDNPSAWKKAFDSYREILPEVLRGLLSQDLMPELAPILEELASNGSPLTELDWLYLLEGSGTTIDQDGLNRLIRWADILSLVVPSEGGTWAIDRIVGRAFA